MTLPRFYPVFDSAAWVARAVPLGVKLVQLRVKDAPHDLLRTEITTALDQQSVVVTGTNAAALVIPRLAAQLATLRKQRDDVAAEVTRLRL